MGESYLPIGVDEAKAHVQRAIGILVCAYQDEGKCRDIAFPGALTLQELERRLDQLPSGQEIIFYCA